MTKISFMPCRALLTASLLLSAAGCMQSRERVVDNPAFDSSNTELLAISKIVLADTATLLHVDAYHSPGSWIRIASGTVLKGADSRVYKLLGSENFELDAQVAMPPSGHVPFTLRFEPVSRREKHVDFVEGDQPGDFRIENIRLYAAKSPPAAIRCTLKGEVINRPQSSRLALLKRGEDFRSAKVAYIPIREGKFEHTLHGEHEEACELIFCDELWNGAWRPILFFAEQGEVHFTLYPSGEWEKTAISGGALNREAQAAKKAMDDKIYPLYDSLNAKRALLEKEGKYYTAQAAKLEKQMSALPVDNPKRSALFRQYLQLRDAGKTLTPEASALEDEAKAIAEKRAAMALAYAKENATIAGYDLLVSSIRQAAAQPQSDVAPMLAIYSSVYKSKYPNHPYSAAIESCVSAASVKVGNPYIDVTAAGPDGKEVKLSELIAGKVALIHLWASWCGPCIRHGREMIPVYEAYKDKGFTVVGVAREKSKESMATALQNVKYPWVTLLELNDRHGIWAKYGIGNAGGGDFLVDDKGVLLAVKTTPEEVKNILKRLLK